MSPELIAILAVGVALGTLMLSSLDRVETSLTARIGSLESGQAELRERMAHLEGPREAIAHNRAA